MKIVPFALLLLVSGCGRTEKSSLPTSQVQAPATAQVRLLVGVGGKTGFVDETGRLIINPQWDEAFPFKEGLAIVCVGECDFEHRVGYRLAKNFRQIPLEQTYKFGYIDENGKLAINPAFEEAQNFSEGLAAVCVGTGCYYSLDKKDKPRKWGYIDKTGLMVIPVQFDEARDFKEGLASVSIGGKCGYVDKNGKFSINPQFDFADSFENGFARVGLKAPDKEDESKFKFGYIDKTGK
jgi:hypothetical protein